MNNKECNNAILRIIPKINMNKIKDIFNNIEKYNDLTVLSKPQKRYYLKVLEYRYNNILLNVYNKLKSKM